MGGEAATELGFKRDSEGPSPEARLDINLGSKIDSPEFICPSHAAVSGTSDERLVEEEAGIELGMKSESFGPSTEASASCISMQHISANLICIFWKKYLILAVTHQFFCAYTKSNTQIDYLYILEVQTTILNGVSAL